MLSKIPKPVPAILSEASLGKMSLTSARPAASIDPVKSEGPEQSLISPLISNNMNNSQDFDEQLQQFCNKYLDSYSSATIKYLKNKILTVLEGPKRESYPRQLVAAVIYCQYSDIIRVRIKEFASMNQLSTKIFNKRYIKYLTICKKNTFNNLTSLQFEEQIVKKECKLQEDPDPIKQQQQTYQNRSQRKDEASKKPTIRTAKQAIQFIYDGIFKSKYFQTNRREIIEKMARRCDEINPEIFNQLDYTSNHGIKLYYVIYSHFKMLGINISFTKYRQAVGNFVGYKLKRAYTFKTYKLLSNLSQDEQMNHSQSDEDMNDESQQQVY